ncbi:type I addiction module toxin, SymE family [Pectobacterium punjabense]|uniref:Type I addiction module toxin, SymE family n=1 Tax=Pectobacterium punjabense TaxID=2108399 RepID=A0ABX6L2J3_9GAMM|nr:type I addiction module toxin, SymE family [Pectobacterium punjabense]MBS4431951.1 type I addiction module toxin, SymE family [Pectobacterium punjabense]MCE5380496.1 type I addiction module toxin, SymE family [Pectobacterium punjabense]PTA63915.1 hypothetical protein C9I36_12535 [Pectobacterium punjabense]QJA20499.1 type I addiction module toxin, SymE family [Pectobacterium punjabense]
MFFRKLSSATYGFNIGQPVIVTVEHGRLVIETKLRF